MEIPSIPQHQPPRDHGRVSLPPYLLRSGAVLLAVFLIIGSDISDSHAAGAHEAVEAAPGEIVLWRDVPARHAVRQQPDGVGLMLDMGPEEEVTELTDGDFQAIGGQHPVAGGFGLANDLNAAPQTRNTAMTGGMGDPARAVMVSTGALSGATRAAGEQVLDALQGAGLLGAGR
ncbi:MAG TPA: hypothetical protein ENO16_03905 [Chromatiales bacterium]|nr:hypothetical protein [Chromatiales bacterium]